MLIEEIEAAANRHADDDVQPGDNFTHEVLTYWPYWGRIKSALEAAQEMDAHITTLRRDEIGLQGDDKSQIAFRSAMEGKE